jgi:hypothetical protein
MLDPQDLLPWSQRNRNKQKLFTAVGFIHNSNQRANILVKYYYTTAIDVWRTSKPYLPLSASFLILERTKRVCLCDLNPVCPHLPSVFECLNHSSLNLVGTSWHLTPFRLRTSHIPSTAVGARVPYLCQATAYTFPLKRIHETKNCWTRRSLCGPCRMKWDSVWYVSVYPYHWKAMARWTRPRVTKNCWTRRFLCGSVSCQRKVGD